MFTELDRQMARYSPRLRDDLLLSLPQNGRVASALAEELGALDSLLQADVFSGDPVGFTNRYAELVAFQGFMDASQEVATSPYVARARVLVQNYICFVYLKETWLERLAAAAPENSTLQRCTRFLVTGRVRAFRNAISHARWQYRSDFGGIDFWDRASANRSAPLRAFSVDQIELDFWQALTRCVCYVTAEVGRTAG